jgi:hypothetical protein
MTGVKALEDLVQLVSPKNFPPRSGGIGKERKGKGQTKGQKKGQMKGQMKGERANERDLRNGQF